MTKRAATSSSAECRTALVVAGMHRSGTSAMARVLGLAGAGMPDRVIKAASDNPLGFWEPRDVVALNDEILRTVGSDWNDVFGVRVDGLARPLWGDFLPRARSVLALNYADSSLAVMKDPRVSLLTPLWREALTEEGFESAFVIMVRDPIEVAQSIAARGEATIQASVLAWLSHMIAVERDTRDAKRIFVRYSDLVDDWRPVLERIRTTLSVELPVSTEVSDEISRFLSRSARHHTSDQADWIKRSDLWPGVAEAWRWLTEAASEAGPGSAFPSTISDALERLQAQLGPVLTFQQDAASRRERELQSFLSDRERALIRLEAQAAEQRSVAAGQTDLISQLRSELAEAAAALTQASNSEATAIKEAAGQAAQIAALEGQRTTDAAALAEALDTLSTAHERIAALDEQVRAAILASQILEQALVAAADGREQAEDVARSEIAALNDIREALESRISAMTASYSWKLTKPVRVMQKRLRKTRLRV